MATASGWNSHPKKSSLTSLTTFLKQVAIAIPIAIALAFVICGPAETHHDQLCSKYQPNASVTCFRQ